MLPVWILFYRLVAFLHARFYLILYALLGVVKFADTLTYTTRQFRYLLTTKKHDNHYQDSYPFATTRE